MMDGKNLFEHNDNIRKTRYSESIQPIGPYGLVG